MLAKAGDDVAVRVLDFYESRSHGLSRAYSVTRLRHTATDCTQATASSATASSDRFQRPLPQQTRSANSADAQSSSSLSEPPCAHRCCLCHALTATPTPSRLRDAANAATPSAAMPFSRSVPCTGPACKCATRARTRAEYKYPAGNCSCFSWKQCCSRSSVTPGCHRANFAFLLIGCPCALQIIQ